MTERDDTNGAQPRFDDDRLLGFILGLEDDPDLEEAAASDPALRDRLAAIRADTDAVRDGLERVVSPPPDGYADLRDPRWGELRELVAAPAPAATRRRPAWLRVLAPAAAIVLVLVAGVVGMQRLGNTGGNEAATSAVDEKATEGYGDDGATVQGEGTTRAEGSDGAAAPALGAGALDPAGFATVLVARAVAPAAFRQRFEILRVLQGDQADFVPGEILRLDMVGRAVAPDRLVVLYLEPLAETDAVTPAPVLSAGGSGGAVIEYEFRRETAYAQQLPGDTDPDKVTLP
jgi:hypothetical protein